MSRNEEKKFRETTPSTTIAWGCHSKVKYEEEEIKPCDLLNSFRFE